ncbi:NACHT domain-containing protein [Streptomyces sp. NPDC013157]|uniref:NACHT domain-containing protein n=1 Tax=Streptomyces sp. NPDC013157 TaxID=3364861 RepID=UPI0036D0A22C
MGVRRLLRFSDALVLLGAEPARLAALDRVLGGALNLATGGISGTVIGMADARGRVLGLGRDAVQGIGARLGRAHSRAERTDVLRAAHTVVVVVAFFEAMQELDLPFALDEVDLTRGEQLALARVDSTAPAPAPQVSDLVALLVAADLPGPAPHLSSEAVAAALLGRYDEYAGRFLAFVEGLAVWERLDMPGRREARRLLMEVLPRTAQARYQGLYTQLCVQGPEFGLWTAQMEHQATRAEVHRALDGVETLLARTAQTLRPPVDVAAALARAHEAALARTILDAESAPDGILIPTLEELYLDPHFRVSGVSGPSGPADESWWERVPVRRDLTRYLAGALTSPHLAGAPLLVLGQPGAGKSALTRVLAARLPAVGFLPVRVPLRDVRAEDELQDQIEQAIRAATGEAVSWPELVRAAGGSTPVLLLDGFDELLQTTGVHQNNFLIRVAQFQRREAEQGRPVLALVTSRTAVADRARYPDGLVALRLEPFQDGQIRQWLAVWNAANEAGFRARGRAPLTWGHVVQHAELAAQPLLLTMLALYDATDGGLQHATGDSLDAADLYEQLLTSFARREVRKSTLDAVPDEETTERVEQELQRLSLVAFAQLNRRRQWVSAAELEEDLTAVLGRQQAQAAAFRTPLNAAETALGRFFFVQRAQSVRDGQVLASYEFLHATFGEYLAIRLALHVLADLLRPRPALSLGGALFDDDLAFALLSYASLSSRQMLRFARSLTGRIPEAERRRLARRLIQVHTQHETRTGDQHPGYRPALLRTATRHGLYGSNLVLVTVLLAGRCSVAELFPDSADPVSAWHRHCQLWRSAMYEGQWTDFALSLSVHPYWEENGRALEVSLRAAEDGTRPPEPLDMNWLYRYPRGHGGPGWSRSYWDEVWHKMSLSAGTNDSVIRHAMDPVFHWLGPAVTTFVAREGASASSLAHDLLDLLLTARDEQVDSRLAALHERALSGIRLLLDAPSPHLVRAVDVLITAFCRDKERLPAGVSDGFSDFLAKDLVPLALGRQHERLRALPPELGPRLFRVLWPDRTGELRDRLSWELVESMVRYQTDLDRFPSPPEGA